VAAQLGVRQNTIIFWEKDMTFPPPRYIPGIIRFIGYQPFTGIIEKTIGEELVLLRQLLGIIQDELANRFNISRTTLGTWERETVYPPKHFVDMIDSLLDVELCKYCV
jgi:DNA-binding XRE family transcriptional regulator